MTFRTSPFLPILLLLLTLLLSHLQPSLSNSVGKTSTCDPYANYGCNKWKPVLIARDNTPFVPTIDDRLECIDEESGPMPWVLKPVRHASYVLSTAIEGKSTWEEGEFIDLILTVKDYNLKFRGLLIHAVVINEHTINGEGVYGTNKTAVGTWHTSTLDSSDPTFKNFHSPLKYCPNAMLHMNADEKALITRLRYKAPIGGIGANSSLIFEALMKTGPANEGEFYHLGVDFVLEKETQVKEMTKDTISWYTSDVRQSCSEHCTSLNKKCHHATLQELTSPTKLLAAVGSKFECKLPILSDCSPVSPSISYGDCYYHEVDEAVCLNWGGNDEYYNVANLDANETKVVRGTFFVEGKTAVDSSCHSYGSGTKNGVRFCPCIGDGSAASEVEDKFWWERRLTETFEEVVKGGNETVSPEINKTLFLLGSFFAGIVGTIMLSKKEAPTTNPTSRKVSSGAALAPPPLSFLTIVTIFSVSFLISPSSAHNWMLSPSRAQRQASSTHPCRARKTSDTHVQVNDQDFSIKWASGHRGLTMIILLKDDPNLGLNSAGVLGSGGLSLLQNDDLEEIIESYIQKGFDLGNSNTANSEGFNKKYHGVHKDVDRDELDFYNDHVTDADGLYKREIFETDPVWTRLLHPFTTTTYLWEYKDDLLNTNGDRYVQYYNEEYPQIEAAGFYNHDYHTPHDFDTVSMSISGERGEGGYVAYWSWRGYSDCTDIDYFDKNAGSKTEVTEVYGLSDNEFGFNRLDHCLYQHPKHIQSQCRIVSSNDAFAAQQCSLDLERATWNNRLRQKRFGVSMVKATAPDITAGHEVDAIPWNQPQCAGLTRIPDEEVSKSYSPEIDFPAWLSSSVTVRNRRTCETVLWTKQLTFRDAILECTPTDCKGFALLEPDESEAYAYSKSTFENSLMEFSGCSSLTSSIDPSRTSFLKAGTHRNDEIVYSTLPSSNPPTTISFSAPRVEIEEVGALTDNGKLFGLNGLNGEDLLYGWNCEYENLECVRNEGECQFGLRAVGRTEDNRPIWFSWAQNVDKPCLDKETGEVKQRLWEAQVENGLYKVSSFHQSWDERDLGLRGCSIENVRGVGINAHHHQPMPATFDYIVEVTDGRLTLQGGPGVFEYDDGRAVIRTSVECKALKTITFQKLDAPAALPEVWFPSSANPSVSVDISSSNSATKIGLVEIILEEGASGDWRNDSVDSVRSWLFFKDNKLRQTDAREQGSFYGEDEGGIVSVVSADGGESVCERILDVKLCGYEPNYRWQLNDKCPFLVDCKEKSGKTVKVTLPGANRVVDLKVNVHHSKGKMPDGSDIPSDKFICFGIEARTQTATLPEFIISTDPTDPAFYSSCFVREELKMFLPQYSDSETVIDGWKFSGRCVNCDDYAAKKTMVGNGFYAPSWFANDYECRDCEIEILFDEADALGIAMNRSVFSPYDYDHGTDENGVPLSTVAGGGETEAKTKGLVFDNMAGDLVFISGCLAFFGLGIAVTLKYKNNSSNGQQGRDTRSTRSSSVGAMDGDLFYGSTKGRRVKMQKAISNSKNVSLQLEAI